MTPDELKEVEQFAAEIVEYETTHANPARDAAEDAEWAKLQAQFPGEFVAYVDTWDGDTLMRQVLAHDENIAKISDIAETWPQLWQDTANVDYCYPPNSLAVGMSLLTSERVRWEESDVPSAETIMTPDELKEVEQFAAEIVEYEKTHANPARDAAEDDASDKLQAQFPGEYVAYVDVWDGDTLTRQVLAHAPNYRAIRDQLSPRPDEELETVTVTYVYPPNTVLTTRLLTGEIKAATRSERT